MEGQVDAKIRHVEEVIADMRKAIGCGSQVTQAETPKTSRSTIKAQRASVVKKPGTKVVKLDLGNDKPESGRKSTCLALNDTKSSENSGNSLFYGLIPLH